MCLRVCVHCAFSLAPSYPPRVNPQPSTLTPQPSPLNPHPTTRATGACAFSLAPSYPDQTLAKGKHLAIPVPNVPPRLRMRSVLLRQIPTRLDCWCVSPTMNSSSTAAARHELHDANTRQAPTRSPGARMSRGRICSAERRPCRAYSSLRVAPLC
jgi:hypothetical protein